MKRKALYIIMIIAIILGVVIIKTKDFNYSILYGKHERLEIVLGSDFNEKDIQVIANQTLDGNSKVRTTTLFGTSAAIDTKEFTDEELKNLFTKINEKYNKKFDLKDLKKTEILEELNVKSITDMSDEEITNLISQIKEKYNVEYTQEELKSASTSVRLTTIPKTSLYDSLKGLIIPLAISMGIVMVYFSIRFHKLYKKAWILVPIKLAFELILNQAFIISIIALARIPVGLYIPSILIFIWVLQILSETLKNEKQLLQIKAEKE